jgi:hypothetical protein
MIQGRLPFEKMKVFNGLRSSGDSYRLVVGNMSKSQLSQLNLGDLPLWRVLLPIQYIPVDSTHVYQSAGLTGVTWNHQDVNDAGAGTEPLRWKSTAFNADFQAATVRFFFDDPSGKRTAWGDGTYHSGNNWLSIGG